MKRFLIALLLLLLLAGSFPQPAYAETIESTGWEVRFTESGGIVSNFDANSFVDMRSGMQPGDTLEIRIKLRNEYDKSVDWYMKNEVIRSLETGSAGGGGYAYTLSYTDPAGSEDTLFNSDRVGGTDIRDGREGLREATTSLEDYFYLDSIGKGAEGYVDLVVTLDGETHDNRYQKASDAHYADLTMRFAVEIPSSRKTVVKTGDEFDLRPLYVIMAISGTVFLYLALDGVSDRIYRRRRG